MDNSTLFLRLTRGFLRHVRDGFREKLQNFTSRKPEGQKRGTEFNGRQVGQHAECQIGNKSNVPVLMRLGSARKLEMHRVPLTPPRSALLLPVSSYVA